MSTSGVVAHSSQSAPPTQYVQSTSMEASLVQSYRQKTDPAWDYCTFTQVGNKKTYTLDADTRFRMGESLKETSTMKKRAAEIFHDEHPFGPNVVEVTDDDTSERPHQPVVVSSSSQPPTKRAATSQVVSKSFFAPRTTPGAQPKIKSVLAGISFIRSVNASDIVKDATNLCNLFVELVEFVGSKNVVHLVTDNAANYKVAGRMFLLAFLRKMEGWTEIIRPGPTRFATTFIALKSIHKHQHDLAALVTSKTFVESRYYRDPKARDFVVVVLDSRFWNDVEIIVKIVAPLVCLLRIVDGDDRPSLGYVYDGMFRAKKAIKTIFKNKKSLHKPYTRIIKQRWDKHPRQQLHVAAYAINPTFYYDKENLSQKPEVMAGFLDVLTTQVDGNRTKFLNETNLYRGKVGEFGKQLALDSIKHMCPDMWWNTFGHGVPNVQKWAIKILSQTASSSGCERNWSVFERIHTKKRKDWSIKGELAPTIGLEEGWLNLDSFPQEDVNSYSGADDDGFHHFND
ncbi:hypothetical protein TSUD_22190 [Trifolium subterraneum]|uniref:DUF659 domain-containing protein n=1 Tax=Trifolium subterraneum TaxID=3900 RepID=A0A2Z6MPY9_TRISU|nr:hypothetical protein TSUD_22190 [Trifolium subterraneum]